MLCYNDLKHQNFADAIVKLTDVLSHSPDNEAVHWGLGLLAPSTRHATSTWTTARFGANT